MNRRQARWVEELATFNFDLYNQKGSSNRTADASTRCPAFTSRERGTTVAGNQTLLRKEQWLEVGAMEIEDDQYEVLKIAALKLDLLLPEAKQRIKDKALLDEQYRKICQRVACQHDAIDVNFSIKENLLCSKSQIYILMGLWERILQWEQDLKIAGHFGRVRTLELVRRNFSCPNMEMDVRRYCNQCDNCHSTKSPRHDKHGLSHPLEHACMPWTHITMDCITDLPESGGATLILVVVDWFTKMSHLNPSRK